MFSEKLERHLRNYGWHPDRKVDITEWCDDLKLLGLTMLPDAERIIENFGGLEIDPLIEQDTIPSIMPSKLLFNPITSSAGEEDRIKLWQEHFGLKMTPFAWGTQGENILLGEDNKVYSQWDVILWLVGNTFEDALETLLCDRKEMEEIGYLL